MRIMVLPAQHSCDLLNRKMQQGLRFVFDLFYHHQDRREASNHREPYLRITYVKRALTLVSLRLMQCLCLRYWLLTPQQIGEANENLSVNLKFDC